MLRLLSIIASLCGLFMSALLAAQTPPSASPPRVAPPPPALTPENTWNLELSTGGRVVIQLRPDMAPNQVERIKTLTRQGFYNGLAFFRVIEGFMAQGGDPNNNGTGGSTLPNVNAEINGLLHVRGAVAAARSDDMNSANSQFYIMFVPRLNMDQSYTVFGRVVAGMNYVDAIERGEPPLAPSRIVRASLGSDNLPPMSAAELSAAAARMAAAAAPPAVPAPSLSPSGAVNHLAGPPPPPPPSAPHHLPPVRAPGGPPH
jgi:cyclophilin family peptidyl-prolyl cis-trans isomerase